MKSDTINLVAHTWDGPFEIWKYTFEGPRPVFEVPYPATLLKIAAQYDEIVAWFKVSPTADRHRCEFLCINTGVSFDSDLDDRMSYKDTVQIGPIIWHVFGVCND